MYMYHKETFKIICLIVFFFVNSYSNYTNSNFMKAEFISWANYNKFNFLPNGWMIKLKLALAIAGVDEIYQTF